MSIGNNKITIKSLKEEHFHIVTNIFEIAHYARDIDFHMYFQDNLLYTFTADKDMYSHFEADIKKIKAGVQHLEKQLKNRNLEKKLFGHSGDSLNFKHCDDWWIANNAQSILNTIEAMEEFIKDGSVFKYFYKYLESHEGKTEVHSFVSNYAANEGIYQKEIKIFKEMFDLVKKTGAISSYFNYSTHTRSTRLSNLFYYIPNEFHSYYIHEMFNYTDELIKNNNKDEYQYIVLFYLAFLTDYVYKDINETALLVLDYLSKLEDKVKFISTDTKCPMNILEYWILEIRWPIKDFLIPFFSEYSFSLSKLERGGKDINDILNSLIKRFDHGNQMLNDNIVNLLTIFKENEGFLDFTNANKDTLTLLEEKYNIVHHIFYDSESTNYKKVLDNSKIKEVYDEIELNKSPKLRKIDIHIYSE